MNSETPDPASEFSSSDQICAALSLRLEDILVALIVFEGSSAVPRQGCDRSIESGTAQPSEVSRAAQAYRNRTCRSERKPRTGPPLQEACPLLFEGTPDVKTSPGRESWFTAQIWSDFWHGWDFVSKRHKLSTYWTPDTSSPNRRRDLRNSCELESTRGCLDALSRLGTRGGGRRRIASQAQRLR